MLTLHFLFLGDSSAGTGASDHLIRGHIVYLVLGNRLLQLSQQSQGKLPFDFEFMHECLQTHNFYHSPTDPVA
jgi:hypothetical protein